MTLDLHTSYAGIELRNPLLISPAGVTGTVKRMKKAEEAGCGAVVVKTLFEDVITRKSPTPRFKILDTGPPGKDSLVLYSYEQASPFDEKRYAKEIVRAKKKLDIPIIASIGCNTDEGWKRYARMMEEAGADGLELNVSCPHARAILSEGDVSAPMCNATKMVKEELSIPIIPKMTPQTANPISLALKLCETGADALVMFNRFTGLEIDMDREAPIMHGSFAGHGGPWSIHYTLRWLIAASPKLKIPIAASGGIWSGMDMVKGLLAGAQVTQSCSAIVVNGYEAICTMLDQLRGYMSRKGYSRIGEFRGNACGNLLSTTEVDRRRKVIAAIDPEICTGCGICKRVCIYDSVSEADGIFHIKKSCQGCGLCAELCPVDAISLSMRGRSQTET